MENIKLYKYEFGSKEAYESLLNESCGVFNEENETYTYPEVFAKIELGFLTLTNGVYDAEGKEITAPILSEKYCVDIVWKNNEQNINFENYEVNPENPKHKIL